MHKFDNYFTELVRSKPNELLTKLPPLSLDADSISDQFRHYFSHTLGRDGSAHTTHYPYKAIAMVVRDRLMERWKNTQMAYEDGKVRRTYYLSLEFLMGRALGNAMLNLGITDVVTQALHDFGIELEEIARVSLMPVLVMVVLAALRPVFSIAAPLCNCR